ncbi:hypothetical protein [Sphingobacterium paludis]|uniref:DUF4350 domain-containing protein n=1 Tax=Sphingobacterium paludis TaxID=1476465 RepID=A0A4V3E1D7_9SPHI|nr:hypothetical protein [Sphingobacterium paludis]TDS12978.1 hypothetical protein B0I21_105109 [Sphingobacterium paludis]
MSVCTIMCRLVILVALFAWLSIGRAQQVADRNFDYPIAAPVYEIGRGALILFDEAHNNASTLRGTYAAFAKLLASDGYSILPTLDKITPELLKTTKIYVTVNAMYATEDWNLPGRSAFSMDEILALSSWVANGGSLFLVTDHMPCGASVHELGKSFGINVLNGFALRKDGQPEVFAKRRKTLLDNEITNAVGNNVDSIMCWGGTGFIAPSHAHIISTLGEDYNIYFPHDVSQIKRLIADTIPYVSGVGVVNGAYLKFGRGKIVVFADGAPFSAQLQGIKSEKRGMNHTGARQNAKLLLNSIHWLDGKL